MLVNNLISDTNPGIIFWQTQNRFKKGYFCADQISFKNFKEYDTHGVNLN